MNTDLRRIEDYLPIEAISAEASREKSVRKGHISCPFHEPHLRAEVVNRDHAARLEVRHGSEDKRRSGRVGGPPPTASL